MGHGLQAEESHESIARLRPGERVYTAQQGAGEASRYKRGSSTKQGTFHGALQHWDSFLQSGPGQKMLS